nr:MAG TPA: hypothetical protein [Caudoviricetes sp.]
MSTYLIFTNFLYYRYFGYRNNIYILYSYREIGFLFNNRRI